MARVADLMGGQAFSEEDVSAAGDAVAEIIGEGGTSDRTIPGARVALCRGSRWRPSCRSASCFGGATWRARPAQDRRGRQSIPPRCCGR